MSSLIQSIPRTFKESLQLESLQSLREGIASGRLKGAKELRLLDGLSEFPAEIVELSESLELLVLSGNDLRSLPLAFSQLKKLKIVFFNNNNFETFPTVLAQCPHLSMISFKGNQLKTIPEGVLSPAVRWLILTDNQIAALPSDIGQLSKLQKLMLAGNELRSLPPEMANCTRLELIRLSANQLTELPEWLFTLPSLSWLAYAGNPFCQAKSEEIKSEEIKSEEIKSEEIKSEEIKSENKTAETTLPSVNEYELSLGEVLGQGASGVIYKGEWQKETVAVKLFKGEVTSDGLPLDEMRACIAAGNHPNLVNVRGKLHTVGGKKGLIFSFIGSEYINLGGPPSLESCTRDTYDENLSFSLAVVLKIAQGIASAIAHLHTEGITHGDLYAHNILINEVGDSILGDFGAASFFDPKAEDSIQKIESRAYGCLLEDLLDRCKVDKTSKQEVSTFRSLQNLQASCLSTKPEKRPLFKEICQKLHSAITH